MKVKLRTYPHRGPLIADPDSPLVGLLAAMAEKKIATLSAAKGYASFKTKGKLSNCLRPSPHVMRLAVRFTKNEFLTTG